MKNKRWILGLAMFAAALTVGCGGRTQEVQEEQKVAAPTAAEETQEADAPLEDSSEKEPEEESGKVTGTVKSFTGSYLSILDENQDTLDFDLGDGTLECKNGIVAGDLVTVVYEGELGAVEPDVPKVLRVVDPKDKPKLSKKTVTGIVADASAHTLTIQMDKENSEDTITFFTVGTKFRCKKGIGPDNQVKVTYLGEMVSHNARNVKVLSVVDEEETEDTASKQDEEQTEIMARIVGVDDTLLKVKLEDEEMPGEYEFDLSGASINLKYGFLGDSQVILTCEGELKKDGSVPRLLAVTNADRDAVNTETGGFSITGTVMAVGSGTMTVTSDDGAQITCNTKEAEMNINGNPRLGSYVALTIEPNSKSNVYKALKISDAY